MTDHNPRALQQIQALASPERRVVFVVFVSGNFNVVHPGHLRLLQYAADCGDLLVVGVQDDSSPGARLPAKLRLEAVQAISIVDYAFVLEEPAERFIAQLQPAVVVKGKEYEAQRNAEQEAVDAYGGKLLFGSGEVRFSSLDLLQRDYFEANFSTVRKPGEFPARHGFRVPELKLRLPRFDSLRVVVVGDLIVDEYINCDPLGMSQEDPTIVVTPIERSKFVGGAAIVSAHVHGLGAAVRYLGVAGKDEAAWFAKQTLDGYGVPHTILEDDSRPTTLKQRFRAAGKTLLRVSHLRQQDVRPQLAARILEEVEAGIGDTDLVIFSDFNYGCLPQSLVNQIVALANRQGVAMVADSQASSQLSDVSRFIGMLLITPTEREARLALRDSSSGLAVIAAELQRKAQARNVVITLGSEGALIYAPTGAEWLADQLPAFNTSPKDTAGAGDSFLATAALGLCAGMDMWQSAYLGCLAAACQTSRVGNVPLTRADLIAEIDIP